MPARHTSLAPVARHRARRALGQGAALPWAPSWLWLGAAALPALVFVATLGCGRKPIDGPTRAQAPTEGELDAICASACAHSQACATRKAAAGECQRRCIESMQGADETRLTGLAKCQALGSCTAILGCFDASNTATPGQSLGFRAAVSPSCARVCQRAAQCRSSVCATADTGEEAAPDAPAAEGCQDADALDRHNATCLSICASADRRIHACAGHNGCSHLLACLESNPDPGFVPHADEPDAPQPLPGVDPACTRLCDRAIACAAADDDPRSSDIAAVGDELTRFRLECGLSCSEDHAAHESTTDAAIARCLELDDCERFLECANEI